ncbi:DNA ligase D [Ramlibacter sp. USB13]|uniref:DNA ligase (ATP) n=1 Tax=Ramlibacter cellulosilyticus TaxID=2764187 RepID=A0A923SC41_9BURK|nr:DNA ligase D [Ramlibacter cellulosilyticus]MBC5784571.1 DNA ligase D [Ramlibacter cellulosilyticus]
MADKSALKTYRDKRNFDATPEPAEGGEANESARSFVIQKHWATRLHYDFRLELEGTMKSWAVPKGPSFDPNDKRMAMPTEDHPIAYNKFEGTIPPGNYGAGKVIIWDKGTWIPLEDPHKGYRDGKLKFELRGHKMHGHWTLVRMKGRGDRGKDPWLLIKERDDFARPAAEFSVVDEMPDSVQSLADRPPSRHPRAGGDPPPKAAPARDGPPEGARKAKLPDTLQPELAVLVDEPPEHPEDWVFEIKFDGYRMLARAEGGEVQLVTRNGNDWTPRLPGLVKALRSMELPDGWYDGEIIMPGKDTPADFQALQGAFDSKRTEQIVYYLFDLPFCAGHDLRDVPLTERRAVLQRICERKPHPNVRFSAVFDVAPQDMLDSACRLGLEGVIAKRRDSAYVGRRSSDWIKLKCKLRQEFVIGGWTDPKGSRTGIGSLLLGVHGDDGKLRYAGNVGTGFNEEALRDLRKRLDALAASRKPFEAGTGLPRDAHWVRPDLVCEVSFGEWTRDGKIRHSVFHGLRSDKPAAAVGEEPVLHEPPPDQPAARPKRAAKKAAAPAPAPAAAPAAATPLPSTLRISNPDRVVDPQSKITKVELVRYYALVAPLMMPHLEDRPIAMVRAPDGIEGQLFFQKHLDRYKMAGVEPLAPEIFPGHPPMVKMASAEGLLSAAQMNVIEIHTWNGVVKTIDRPDRMTFDIDPGEGVTWAQIQEAATLVRTMLDELQLPCFLKTSGGKGLHLVVPLKPRFDWDTVKDFSQAVVQHLSRTLPDRFVAKSGAKNRVGRIFIDYLRNGYGATTVCAWSARARPGLGISVPTRWDELPALKGGAHWTVGTAHQRLDQGNAPWDDYEKSRCTLDDAMKKLGFEPR